MVMLEIRAFPGEAVADFAERMTTLRDFTDDDFVAVHNDRDVTVTREIGVQKFLAEWEIAGEVKTLAEILLPAIQSEVSHDTDWDQALAVARKVTVNVSVRAAT